MMDPAQLRRLQLAAQEGPAVYANGYHIAKLETGMFRIGFAEQNIELTRWSPRGGVILSPDDARNLGQLLVDATQRREP